MNLMKNGMQGLDFHSPGAGKSLSTVLFAGLTEELFSGPAAEFPDDQAFLCESRRDRRLGVCADSSSKLAFVRRGSSAALLANIVSVFVVGLLLGGVFEKSRNLWGRFSFMPFIILPSSFGGVRRRFTMDKMLKRLKWTEILEGALVALAGLACVIFPGILANMFSFLIGAVTLVIGICQIFNALWKRNTFLFQP